MCLVYKSIKNVKNSNEIVHFMLLLRWISFSWFEQNIENGKRYIHVQKFFYHSKRRAMYTVFIYGFQGWRETRVKNWKNLFSS